MKFMIKLRIAYLLKDLFPRRWCWFELVQWSLGNYPWEEVGAPNHCGYCGACEENQE